MEHQNRERESFLRGKEEHFSDQRVKTELLSSVTVIKTIRYYIKTQIYDIYQICRGEFMFQCHGLISSNCLLCDNKFIFSSVYKVISGRWWGGGGAEDRDQTAV